MPESDTLKIDTLSLVAGTFERFTPAYEVISHALYTVDYTYSALITDSLFRQLHPIVLARYRVFNLNFSEISFHKSSDSLKKQNPADNMVLLYQPAPISQSLFGMEQMTSDGSISRGISVGNSQDAVVSSSLNLQLAGKLTDNLNIRAAITDNNIPVQPEGTTQQIQEFDKVYIQIYNERMQITAGDFEVKNPSGYFMRFNKKAQGGLFDVAFNGNEEKSKTRLESTAAAAISKGRFARQTITALEGNQGPYKLKGNNNESFIIVLAGTEKVYIDGKILQRGRDNDYIIDYNTAEIVFMPLNMITKDKRIIVEFEYSDKNYARALFYTGNTLKNDKLKLQVNFFTEQDIKSQPQNQDLTAAEKLLLSQIGDSLNMAVAPHIDSMDYSAEFVMYRMTDTLVNGVTYDSVFVYSTHPDSAHYRLGFSSVGQGNGNYVQQQSAANGRVFMWVAPVNGVRQGSYEPVTLLITPKKQQLFTSSLQYKINKKTNSGLELAVSQADPNTFSKLGNNDNNGMAVKFNIENLQSWHSDSSKSCQFRTSLSHEWAQRTFKPIERYRDAEFERLWNIVTPVAAEEHFTHLKLNLSDNKRSFATYSASGYLRESLYKGLLNSFNTALYKKRAFLLLNASLTNTYTNNENTRFLRQNTHAGYHLGWFTLGVKNETERNRFADKLTDTLTARSFSYEQYEVYLSNADTSGQTFNGFFRLRNDFHPLQSAFSFSSRAEEAGVSAALNKSALHRFNVYSAFRKLYRISPYLQQHGIKPDDTFIGRLEYGGKLFKGLLSLNTFYETSSGLEVKNEFIYAEVQPGQGAYTWTDYNHNNIKELDEFEVAVYQDQANYVKVIVPTNTYIKAYAGQFNQIIHLNPASVWSKRKGFLKFMTRFSEQFTLQLLQKTTAKSGLLMNPLALSLSDTSLLTDNTVLKNTFSYNSVSSAFGFDYNYNSNKAKALLINGYESRALQTNMLRLRFCFYRKFFLNITGQSSEKEFLSEYFSNRNYSLTVREAEPVLSYQPNTRFRFSVSGRYAEKLNTMGNKEKAYFRQVGTECRYSRPEKGSLMLKAGYINIGFNAPANTPLAYEMLDALQAGHNVTWNVLFQKNLKNNMQLSLMYDGRVPGKNKTVHFGTVQLRAYF